ncbi:MAG: MBL fold metallo-hydrolase [Planctomycetota bacterium]|nr:MBL fold metallo-hydrolase [Planctomycetota bacterium]
MHAPLSLLLFASLASCLAPAATPSAPTDRPYAIVLGTAQDAGRPQLGCEADCCESARRDPDARRLVASLAIVDPRSGRRWLLDASPDLGEQIALLGELAPAPAATDGPGRPALFDAIILTHAHIGHYLGLAELGREAYGSAPQRVIATPRMADFLRDNGPWSLLIDAGHVELVELRPTLNASEAPLPTARHPSGVPIPNRIALADDLHLELLAVPHRDEFSDTVAIRVTGPSASLLYLPDIDKWERWGEHERELATELARVDHAFLDATFFGPDELPGRAMSEVPHPFVVETIAALAGLPASERAKVHLIHLNHTNPLNEPGSDAREVVREAGMSVAARGEVFGL